MTLTDINALDNAGFIVERIELAFGDNFSKTFKSSQAQNWQWKALLIINRTLKMNSRYRQMFNVVGEH